MEKHRSFIVVLGLFAVAVVAALVAAACRDSTTPVAVSPNRPPFWQAACNASGECPPPCPSLKMTGGGRIDAPPGGPNKNPPSSHQFQTFGAHVIQGLDQSGNCVIKGSLEWVDHSIRINGRPLNLHSIAISS